MNRKILWCVRGFLLCVALDLICLPAPAQTGPGLALDFNAASNQWAYAAESPGLAPFPVTFEAWVKPRTAKCNTILSRGDGISSTSTSYIFQVGNDGTNCGVMKVALFISGAWVASASTIPLNSWTHVAVTYDGTTEQFFINGVLDRTVTRSGTFYSGGVGMYVGLQGQTCLCNYFDGQMDEVRMWGVVRTASQIRQSMNQSLTGNEAGLVTYYRMDDGPGGGLGGRILSDSTSGGSHGAVSGGGAINSSNSNYPTWVTSGVAFIPYVSTSGATAVSNTTAIVQGTGNPGNLLTGAWYQWGTSTNYGNNTTVTSLSAVNATLAVSNTLTGLIPGTTYHFRIAATNSAGTNFGGDQTFISLAPPAVTTLSATGIAGTAATLNGNVTPKGAVTSYFFEYGLTTNYGNVTTMGTLPADNNVHAVSNVINGLLSGAVYHFSLVATNSQGTNSGGDMTFLTPMLLPSLVTLPPSGVSNAFATLNASISPGGADTTAWFEWGIIPGKNTNTTPAMDIGSGGGAIAVSNNLSGFTPGAVYYYAAVASNAFGMIRGRSIPFGSPTIRLNSVPLANTTSFVLSNECHSAFADPMSAVSIPLATASGYMHNMILKGNGTVAAWGEPGPYGEANVPAGLSNVIAIAAGGYHSLALRSDGTVVAWGAGTNTTISGVNNEQSVIPTGLSNVVAIAAGIENSLALKSDGTVVAWGNNSFGQNNIPAGLTNAVAICATAQANTCMALKNDGTVVAWGDNSFGLLNIPAGLSNVEAISMGTIQSLALRSDGTVVVWGNNQVGSLNVPAAVSNNVVAIAAGSFDCAALLNDTTVVMWGENNDGEADVPAGLSNVVAISSGGGQSVAVKSDGTVVTWGLQPSFPAIPGGLTIGLPLVRTGSLDTNTVGVYPLLYTCSNNLYLGGTAVAAATLNLNVVDTTPPVVTLLGNDPLLVTNLPFVDPGATSFDLCGGIYPVVTNSKVNLNFPGTYSITYSSTDSSGNTGYAVRTVAIALPPTVPGDTNGDGIITQDELAAVLSHLDPHGAVNQANFNAMLSNYFAASPYLLIANTRGLGQSNVTFAISNFLTGAFTMQVSTNLVDWQNLGPVSPSFFFTDTNAPAGSPRFYRLKLP